MDESSQFVVVHPAEGDGRPAVLGPSPGKRADAVAALDQSGLFVTRQLDRDHHVGARLVDGDPITFDS
jgi:hypothetical protein